MIPHLRFPLCCKKWFLHLFPKYFNFVVLEWNNSPPFPPVDNMFLTSVIHLWVTVLKYCFVYSKPYYFICCLVVGLDCFVNLDHYPVCFHFNISALNFILGCWWIGYSYSCYPIAPSKIYSKLICLIKYFINKNFQYCPSYFFHLHLGLEFWSGWNCFKSNMPCPQLNWFQSHPRPHL